MTVRDCVLVVETDDLIRQLLERWLGEAGYRVVVSAPDSIAAAVVPQLVIADISNPVTSSDTIGSLRAAYAAPILALSTRFRRGLAGSSAAAQRLRVGKVLPKPFTREELLQAVRDTVVRD
ncbi:MAG TPA: hypothetical protein VMV45_06075 [Casimicrobiaceae bacterium]|nr:hypothetical protein [Casimicrobiaceae bacterium]